MELCRRKVLHDLALCFSVKIECSVLDNFTPIPFGNAKITGAFAVCMYADNSMIYETMSLEEIESVRDNYAKKDKSGNFSRAWQDSFGEMAKKTVLRRLTKLIELEFDSVEQKKEYDDSSDFEFKEITDIQVKEEVKMPKEKKLPESLGEIVKESPPDNETSDKKDFSVPDGRTRNGMISDMRSWARQKNFDLELFSMTNFEKEVEELDMFELGQLEDEVTKIKTKPE